MSAEISSLVFELERKMQGAHSQIQQWIENQEKELEKACTEYVSVIEACRGLGNSLLSLV